MSKTFLNVDEAAALRDTLDNLRQSAYETDASYTRRFRDLAQECYPSHNRNIDQERILVRGFARGLRSVAVAIKMIEQSNPQTLLEAMQWLASFSERNDVVSRLGLTTSEDVPMEISAVQPPASAPSQLHDQALEKVLRGQEHIMTKLAKLEAFQSHVAKKQSRRPEASGNYLSMQASHNRLDGLPNWSPDGQPRCFACGIFGHMKRKCPTQTNNKQERAHQQRSNYRM